MLRLSHRRSRDTRVTTHCGLVARALGAQGIYIAGERDQSVIDSILKVTREWGGDFFAQHTGSPKKLIQTFNGKTIHLTMYGIPIQNTKTEISCEEDILLVIGGAKVHSEYYKMVDHNIAVTNQPHSEIAALAICLDKIFDSKELSLDFNGKMTIIPQKCGKKMVTKDG